MSPNARRDDRAESVGLERPHRRLARGAAAEVLGRDQDLRVAVRRLVEDELRRAPAVGVEAHVVEEEARVAPDALGLRRKRAGMMRSVSMFGRSIGAATAVTRREGFHHPERPATSVRRPVTAAAAAIAGLMRCVRAPLPWRPSKLRFDVDAHALALRRGLAVHADAHRAARLAPLEAGVAEDAIEAFGLGRALDRGPSPARPTRARPRAVPSPPRPRRAGRRAGCSCTSR